MDAGRPAIEPLHTIPLLLALSFVGNDPTCVSTTPDTLQAVVTLIPFVAPIIIYIYYIIYIVWVGGVVWCGVCGNLGNTINSLSSSRRAMDGGTEYTAFGTGMITFDFTLPSTQDKVST